MIPFNSSRIVLSNGRLVLPDRVIEGSIVLENEIITEVIPGKNFSDALDLNQSWVIPGIIDTHTDYIEKEINPRPSANFPLSFAFQAMDRRALNCGVTTVCGAVRVSLNAERPGGGWPSRGRPLAQFYENEAYRYGARHYMHLRWDTNFQPAEEVIEEIAGFSRLGNLVFNDSIPGERQFRLDELHQARLASKMKVEVDQLPAALAKESARLRELNNRPQVAALLRGKIPLGSHDDTTVEHVDEAFSHGCLLSEMPTTLEAARRARQLGMQITMGAPNYFRGGSHCGNLSCVDALQEDLVDILCSDYHFPSLLACVVKMLKEGVDPSRAVNLVTLNPAKHLGLDNEIGSLEEGKRADVIVFDPYQDFGDVRYVWVDGVPRIAARGMVVEFKDANGAGNSQEEKESLLCTG